MHTLVKSIPPENGNFTELVLRHCKHQPWVTALVMPEQFNNRTVIKTKRYSFGDLGQRIKHIRAGLRRLLKKGDRVVVMFKPGLDLYAMVLALLAEGMVPVFIDTGMGIAKMLKALDDANAKMIVSMKALFIPRFILKAFKGKHWICVDGQGLGLQSLDALASFIDFTDPSPVTITDSDHGLISFTSGSTGKPKGADRTHDSLIQQHIAIREHWYEKAEDIDMTSLPVVVLHNLCCGMPSVLPAMNFSSPVTVAPCVVIEQIIFEKVTRLTGAPAWLERLSDWIIEHHISLGNVQAVGIGGAPVTVKVARKLKQAFPQAEIRVVYGSTEAEPIGSVPIEELIADQTSNKEAGGYHQGYLIGRPGDHTQVKLVNLPENTADITDLTLASYEVKPGETGEIVVRGKHVLKGYVDNPDATKENKIILDDGSVWHRTGDIARIDGQGRNWLLGRLSDRISVSDRFSQEVPQNIYTYVVESKIDMLPNLYRSALISSPEPNKPLSLFYQKHTLDGGTESSDTCSLERDMMRILSDHGIKSVRLVELKHMPVDSRHNSKINRARLKKKLSGISKRCGGRCG